MADFGTRERQRQAHFRNSSLTITHEGRSPSDDKGHRHGHLLALGCEQQNLYPPLRGPAGASRFLADRRIKWWSSSRSGDKPGSGGPTRNLASSQVACINFMLPLADNPDALVAALSSIDDDILGVAKIENPSSKTSSLVEFEWIGLQHALEGPSKTTRGANTTSIDAFVIVQTRSGRRAYLLEWKYVEEYREKFLGDGSQGKTRHDRYSKPYAESFSFKEGIPLDAWFYEPFYQISRQRLLADRMVRDRELDVSEAKVVVVVPEGNHPYRTRITSPALASIFPDARSVEEVVRAALVHPDETFACVSPASLANAVRQRCGNNVADWSEYLLDRYGW